MVQQSDMCQTLAPRPQAQQKLRPYTPTGGRGYLDHARSSTVSCAAYLLVVQRRVSPIESDPVTLPYLSWDSIDRWVSRPMVIALKLYICYGFADWASVPRASVRQTTFQDEKAD